MIARFNEEIRRKPWIENIGIMNIKSFALFSCLMGLNLGVASGQDFKSRFSYQIKNSDEFNIRRGNDLNLDCRKSVQRIYLDGASFHVPEVANLLVTVSEFKNIEIEAKHTRREGLRDNVFYHYYFARDLRDKMSPEYGKSTPMANILASNNLSPKHNKLLDKGLSTSTLDKVLSKLRINDTRYEYKMSSANGYRSVLYLAGSPYSSSSYGDTLLTLVIDPSANILPLSKVQQQKDLDALLIPIIKDRFPDIFESCEVDYFGPEQILQLIFEDSGGDLVHYIPSDDWFQLNRPDTVRQLSIVKMGKTKPGRSETFMGKLKTNVKLILKGKSTEVLKPSEGNSSFRELTLNP
jgi:hypothetical protein